MALKNQGWDVVAETPASTEVPIGGLDLLPDPSDEHAWRSFLVTLGHHQLLTKADLLASIDIPLWIGEYETIGRAPVNIRCPSTLQYHISDSELDWERTVDLACSGTREHRALYYAESVARVHTRLLELGITPEGYISMPDLTAKLDAAYESLQPPYVMFEEARVRQWYDSSTDIEPTVQLRLTDSGEKKRFINLLRARIKHGYTIYGKKSIGPVVNALLVA